MAAPNLKNINESTPAPLKIAIGIALLSWGSAQVAAQEVKPSMPADMEELEVIAKPHKGYVTDDLWSSQYTAPLLDTAKTINVITADVMRDQATDSLADVLNNVPGISMQAGEGGTPAGDQLSIRGFSARTDIFVDGARDFGGYARDSYNLEQVEVAKGPGSNYTGRGSTGGSINMVSKTARMENFIMGTTGFGTSDYKRVTIDGNRQLSDTIAVRMNLLWHDAEVADRNTVANSRYAIATTLAIGLTTGTTLNLSYSHLHQDNVPDYGIPWVPSNNTALPGSVNRIAPVNDSNWYGMSQRDYEDIRNDMVTARVDHDLNDSISFSNQFRWGETYRDSLITAPRFIATDSTDIRRTDWKSRDQTDRIISNHTSVTVETDTGRFQHSLAARVEFSDEYEINYARDITGNQPVTDLFNPAPGDNWGGSIFRTGASTESDGFTTSIYLADTIGLSDQWLFTGGLRWDRFELEYISTDTIGAATRYERTDSEVSYQGTGV